MRVFGASYVGQLVGQLKRSSSKRLDMEPIPVVEEEFDESATPASGIDSIPIKRGARGSSWTAEARGEPHARPPRQGVKVDSDAEALELKKNI